MRRFFSILAIAIHASACGILVEKDPQDEPSPTALVGKPIPPEQAKAMLKDVGQSFVYGPGLGEAALNVGTAVVFPPYLVVLAGNAALSISGYKPLTISRALPDEAGKEWSNTYDSVVSGPGRLTAAVNGEGY